MEEFNKRKQKRLATATYSCSKREFITDGASQLFKVLGDRTRLEIMFALETKSMCVGEISALLNFSQSLVSHQLRILRENNIVSTMREGNKIFYTMADEHIVILLKIAKIHSSEKIKE